MGKAQLEIDFEPGLTEQFPEFLDVLKASVYGPANHKQFKAIAADLDMSPSELSRKLADNPDDKVHFPAKRLADVIKSTQDLRPIYWLIEKFVEDPEVKQKRVMSEVAQLLAELNAKITRAGLK